MEFLLPLVGGAVGAAIINSIVGYLRLRADRSDAASRWQKEQERDRAAWIRAEKQAAYSEFLEEVQTFIHHFGRYNNEDGTTPAQVLSASSTVKNHRLLIAASTEVRTAQRDLGMAINRSRMALSGQPPVPPRSQEVGMLSIELHEAGTVLSLLLRRTLEFRSARLSPSGELSRSRKTWVTKYLWSAQNI
jgi:hypothetical protein